MVGSGFLIVVMYLTFQTLESYARVVDEALGDIKCTLMFEPGRVIAGTAGILVTKVIYVKRGKGRNFVIVDAAMNDLIHFESAL